MPIKRTSPVWIPSKDEFQNIVNSYDTFSEVMIHFGLKPQTGAIKTLYKRIEEENIDCSRINARNWAQSRSDRTSIPLCDILVENSTYQNRARLKIRLIKSGLLPYKCSECGIGPTYNNKELSLQLEHKNGVSNDNRIENLCFLCPNCHSQTPTYSGKNKLLLRKSETYSI